MILSLLLLLSGQAFAGFSELDSSEVYHYEKRHPTKLERKIEPKKSRHRPLGALADQIIKSDQQILEALKRNEKNLIVRKETDKIAALTRTRGILLNSILAMNVRPSTFIVRVSGEEPNLENAELRCQGMSFEKRVPSHCDLLVMEGSEHKVDVELWDLDGAQGIIADYYYSGEEKTFLTSSLASFMEGILNVAQDKITTPYGNIARNSDKNQVLGGLMGVARKTKEKVIESGEKNLSFAYVNSGKEVLVFFNQSLNLQKEDSK